MLTIDIPGRDSLRLEHLILDYNGTVALDGALIESVAQRLERLAGFLKIHVITADTHGTAERNCSRLPVEVLTYPTARVGEIKAQCAARYSGGVVCIGNGFNDVLMSDVCDLSLAVIGREGCCAALLTHVDVVFSSIEDALDFLLRPDRLRATLRA